MDDSVRDDHGSVSECGYSTSSSSNSEVSENESPVSKRPLSGGSEKPRKRRLAYSDSEEDDVATRKKAPPSLPHVTDRSKSRDRDRRKVLREVRKSNKLLQTLVKRVAKTEKRLKVVEGTISKSNSSASCSSGIDSTPSRSQRRSNAKHDVPQAVRVSSILFSTSVHY